MRSLQVAFHILALIGYSYPCATLAFFPRVTAEYARPRQFQLALSAFDSFDGFAELFKNLNITAITCCDSPKADRQNDLDS